MVRFFILGVFIIIANILQISLFPHLTVFGARPDLVLATVLAAGLAAGSGEGLAVGLVGSLLSDLLRGSFIGLSVPGKIILGYIVGFIPKRVYADNYIIPMAVTFGATLLDGLIFLAFGNSFGLIQPVAFSLREYIFPSAVYTTILSPVIFRALKNLYGDFSKRGWFKEPRQL